MEEQKKNKPDFETIKKKLANRVMQYGLLTTTLLGGAYFAKQAADDNTLNKIEHSIDIRETNYATLKKCENLTFAAIAYVEDFKPIPYNCGAKWTIGYGSTVDEKNVPIIQNTPAISENVGKCYVLAHLERSVYPFIDEHVKISLNEEQLIAVAMFIYNVGGENFSGYNLKGEKIGEPSSFLTALNKGQKGVECARMFTGFRASNGKLAGGLPKRHWVTGALFLGKIPAKRLLTLKPCEFYGDAISYYFAEKGGEKVEFYNPDYSEEKISRFLRKNTDLKNSTLLTLDEQTFGSFVGDFTIAEAYMGINLNELRSKRFDKMTKERIVHNKELQKKKDKQQKAQKPIKAKKAADKAR